LLAFKQSLKVLNSSTAAGPSANENAVDESVADDGSEDDDDGESAGDDTNQKCTAAEQLVLDVLDRCFYFIAADNLGDQLIVADILQAGFVRLAVNR
jgi:hypothetical protein